MFKNCLVIKTYPSWEGDLILGQNSIPVIFKKSIWERGSGEKERNSDFVVSLIYAFIGWFSLGIELATLLYLDNALTNWATWLRPIPAIFSWSATRIKTCNTWLSSQGNDLFFLRLPSKKMTIANATVALRCEWINIIPPFVRSKIFFVVPQNFSN